MISRHKPDLKSVTLARNTLHRVREWQILYTLKPGKFFRIRSDFRDIPCDETEKTNVLDVRNSVRINVRAVRCLCPQLCLFILATEMTFVLTEKI